jgi:hypothetical protein
LHIDECVTIIRNKLSKDGIFTHILHGKEKQKVEFNPKLKKNSMELVLEEEELNLLQVIQQGWSPPGLNCFMNETQLIECLNSKTFT